MRGTIIAMILTTAITAHAQTRCDTFQVYFELSKSKLNAEAKGVLLSLETKGALSARDTLVIMGYADMLGNNTINDTLSLMRANNVKEYLQEHGLEKATYKLCTGKGAVKRNLPVPAEGFPADRRVDIIAQSGLLKKKGGNAIGEKPPFDPKIIAHVRKGNAYVLHKIYFYRGRHTVQDTSYKQMDELYEFMVQHPTVHIRLEGHICCVPNGHDAEDEDFPQAHYTGPREDLFKKNFKPDPNLIYFKFKYNDSITKHYVKDPKTKGLYANCLSTNRAWRVYQYLIDKGIDPTRLSYKGFGSSIHAVPETSPEVSTRNMRVEIRIMEE